MEGTKFRVEGIDRVKNRIERRGGMTKEGEDRKIRRSLDRGKECILKSRRIDERRLNKIMRIDRRKNTTERSIDWRKKEGTQRWEDK
jgi:hypothetical protein